MNIVFMSMDTLPSTLWARDLYDQMRAFLLYDQRATKSDSQTVQYGFHLSYHPSENFLFDFIAVQEKTVNFGI